MKSDINTLKTDVNDLNLGQSRIEQKLDAVINQTADLTEFRTEINNKLDSIDSNINTVEAVTKENLYDIAKLKLIK